MAETPSSGEHHQYQFIEPAYTGRSLIYHRLLLGDNPTAQAIKQEMLAAGMAAEVFDASLADMMGRGNINVNEYTAEVSFYRQAPFN